MIPACCASANEYTPYDRRTVYSRGWLLADMDEDGVVGSADYTLFDGVFGKTNLTHRADLTATAASTHQTSRYGPPTVPGSCVALFILCARRYKHPHA